MVAALLLACCCLQALMKGARFFLLFRKPVLVEARRVVFENDSLYVEYRPCNQISDSPSSEVESKI